MSYCSIYTAGVDGVMAEHTEYGNAWRGAAFIWQSLIRKYTEPEILLGSPIWDSLGKANDLFTPDLLRKMNHQERLVTYVTSDGAIVNRRDFDEVANALEAFAEWNVGRSHLPEWAADIRALGDDVQWIGWYHTSVACNPWRNFDDEADEYRPYVITEPVEDSFHFDLVREVSKKEQEL